MTDLQTISFSGTYGEDTLDAPVPFFGRATFDADVAGTFDQASGERVFTFTDPEALFEIGGQALDVSDYEIRLGNNLDFEGRGLLVVDSLAFTASGDGFEVRSGVATLLLETFTGPELPDGPLSLEDDFDSTFATEAFVPDLFDGRQNGDTTQFLISEGVVGQGLSETEARQVAYLYEAGLDRDGNIDTAGLNFWIDAREQGLSVRDLSAAFLDSPEFAAAFGAPETLTDRALVEQFYLNVLDRDGEQGGVDFWTDQLGRADFDRTDLLTAFAASAENLAGSPGVEDLIEFAPGAWDFV
ncbi:MAG: DUF4214 domain-containing protein [Pseudomonadota bacterium]